MRMKKLLVATICLLFAFIVAACNNNGNNGNNEQPVGDLSLTLRIVFPAESNLEDKDLTCHFDEGDTLRDILVAAGKQEGFPVTFKGSGATWRVLSIDNVEEDQYGEDSGWGYMVNDEYPMVSAAEYAPQDGDVVIWQYLSMSDM